MTADLMRIASADQFIAREHRLAHEDAECTGADYETLIERIERHDRERQEDALVASAEAVDAREARWDAEDRAWREAYPVVSEEALKMAREYMASPAVKAQIALRSKGA